jgi:hypothetical protein
VADPEPAHLGSCPCLDSGKSPPWAACGRRQIALLEVDHARFERRHADALQPTSAREKGDIRGELPTPLVHRSDRFDFDHRFWGIEARHLDNRVGRIGRVEELATEFHDLAEVTHIRDEYGDFHDVPESGTTSHKCTLEIGKRLLALRPEATLHDAAVVGITFLRGDLVPVGAGQLSAGDMRASTGTANCLSSRQ